MSLKHWIDLTAPDIAALDKEQTVALIPFGAIEQHGPHLPVGVDGMIVEALIARPELSDLKEKVVLLPLQWVGWSIEHQNFSGTVTASAETLLGYWRGLTESLIASGIRKFVFLNGHGGQPELLRILARELRVTHEAIAVTANWFGFGLPELANTLPEDERKWGIHAGTIETAIIRRIAPETVQEHAAQAFPNAGADHHRDGRKLSPQGPVPWAWMAEDLNREGALGDARASAGATAELGEALLAYSASCLAELIEELADVPRSTLLHLDK